jgi:ATP/maltotriose-dependent transcriptional regulator MalT
LHALLGLLTGRVGCDGLVGSGDKYDLTPRELQVLQLLTKGVSNAEISHRLLIKPTTVKRHLEAIFQKLAVDNRTQAALRAVEFGLVKND